MALFSKFFTKKRKDPESQPLDKFGTVISQAEPPVDHQLLLREEIDFNAAGLVVEFRKIFDDEASGETIFKKVITRTGGDQVVDATQTISAWVKV